MEKLVYLTYKRESDSLESFREKLLGETAARLLERGVRSLTVNIADLGDSVKESPLIQGEGKTLSASISLWLDSLDTRGPIEALLGEISSKIWGYLVTESVPLEYADRDWPDGAKSPGVTLVTAFPKPSRITDEQFFEYWHGSHTPLSFEIHPLWRYIRNAVARSLTPGSPPYRAIVEERFRELDDVLDLNRFFGGTMDNVQRVLDDVGRFLDQQDISCSLMSEYLVKSRP